MKRKPPKEYTSEEMNINLIRPKWYMDYHNKNTGTKLDEEIENELMKLHRVKGKKYLKIMETIPDRETRRIMIDEIVEEYNKKAEALETKYHDRIKQDS